MTIVNIDQGDYEGEVDSDGLRVNVGYCRWSDDSTYNGDWAQNVRHGNGVFVAGDGTKFEGQWCNDFKHGYGILTYPDGEEIRGFWSNDRLNGLAKVKAPGAKKSVTVIYKNDMMIMANDTGVTTCDIIYAITSVILSIAFYAAIPLGILNDPMLFLIMLVYLIYLIWSCCCNSATRYIKNLTPLNEFFDNIKMSIKADPIIVFHIQCYHYKTSGTGKNKKKRRVNTHRATQSFNFSKWEDRSPPAETLHFLSVLLLTRLHTSKTISYSPRAKRELDSQQISFLSMNKRDTSYDYTLR